MIADPLYNDIVTRMPVAKLDIVFLSPDKRKTLLCKRTNPPLKGEWFTIGGRIFIGESIGECAVRKAKEELGLDIEEEQLQFRGVIANDVHDDPVTQFITHHDVVIVLGYTLGEGAVLTLDSQHSEAKWFHVNDTKLHPLAAARVRPFLQ